MSDLNELPNIGKELALKLIAAGITDAEELRRIGSRQAFMRIHARDEESCINCLMALEGAVQGIRWHALSPEEKKELSEFLAMLNIKGEQ